MLSVNHPTHLHICTRVWFSSVSHTIVARLFSAGFKFWPQNRNRSAIDKNQVKQTVGSKNRWRAENFQIMTLETGVEVISTNDSALRFVSSVIRIVILIVIRNSCMWPFPRFRSPTIDTSILVLFPDKFKLILNFVHNFSPKFIAELAETVPINSILSLPFFVDVSIVSRCVLSPFRLVRYFIRNSTRHMKIIGWIYRMHEVTLTNALFAEHLKHFAGICMLNLVLCLHWIVVSHILSLSFSMSNPAIFCRLRIGSEQPNNS